MSGLVGIIAEDISDVEVIKILCKKITGKALRSCHFVGRGCGPLKKKTPGWCKSLKTRGCQSILLIHDRDRKDAAALRQELELILDSVHQLRTVVVIPEEELEAWMLADCSAIQSVFKLQKVPKFVNFPETIVSPKEFLRDQIYSLSGQKKTYVSTVHNKLIAEQLDLSKVISRCPSFKPLVDFFGGTKKSSKGITKR
jgi:Domain of unknown function (DUF4276)